MPKLLCMPLFLLSASWSLAPCNQVGRRVAHSLCCAAPQVLGNTRDVGDALHSLTQFRFVGRREAVVLHPEFINTLSNLRQLELGNCRWVHWLECTAQLLLAAIGRCTWWAVVTLDQKVC